MMPSIIISVSGLISCALLVTLGGCQGTSSDRKTVEEKTEIAQGLTALRLFIDSLLSSDYGETPRIGMPFWRSLSIKDLNCDQYVDVQLETTTNRSEDKFYSIYIYNPSSNTYESKISDLPNLKVDSLDCSIYGFLFYKADAGYGCYLKWKGIKIDTLSKFEFGRDLSSSFDKRYVLSTIDYIKNDTVFVSYSDPLNPPLPQRYRSYLR